MKKTARLVLPFLVLPFAGCVSFGSQGSALAPDSPGIAALQGGLIGQNPAGQALPASARSRALEAEFQALQFAPAGEPVRWTADGFSGEVVPTQLYRVGSQDCRGYTHSFKGSANAVKAIGTACKTEAGLWAPVA